MDPSEQYEKDCRKIKKHNALLLKEFATSLEQKNLTEKTIKKHCSNLDFYINEFLLYEEAIEAEKGSGYIGDFLGYWFIRKAMWASAASIRENASSLKIFYQFMHQNGKISKESLAEMKQTIKQDMPEWIATVKKYDNPEIDDIW